MKNLLIIENFLIIVGLCAGTGAIVYVNMLPEIISREKIGEAVELVRKDDCISGSYVTLVPMSSGSTTTFIPITNYIYGKEEALYSSQKYKITYDNGEVNIKTIDAKLKNLTGCL